MPAQVPPPRLSQAQARLERRLAAHNSRLRLIQHGVLSLLMALFCIGFNVAFLRDSVWSPWPVAGLLLLWLVHLCRYLSLAQSAKQGINVWLDEPDMEFGAPPKKSAPRKPASRAGRGEPRAGEPRPPGDAPGRSRAQRREWLE
ncbi:hypothetical protein AAU61_01900 [Desulfocarbo indianensis]|nr:hypothetical protein AAU61_01900 [Desulfocarbo indianensis]